MSCSAAATMPISRTPSKFENPNKFVARGRATVHDLGQAVRGPSGRAVCRSRLGCATAEYSGIARPVQREDAAVLAVHADAAREPCHDDIPAGQRGR